MVVLPPAAKDCDATIKIFNPDGSEAEACGNGTRYLLISHIELCFE